MKGSRYRDQQILDLFFFFVIMNCNFCYQYEMTVIEFVAFKINPHHVFCIAKSRKNWYSKDNISLPSDLEMLNVTFWDF